MAWTWPRSDGAYKSSSTVSPSPADTHLNPYVICPVIVARTRPRMTSLDLVFEAIGQYLSLDDVSLGRRQQVIIGRAGSQIDDNVEC
jgi:hypothetical protein